MRDAVELNDVDTILRGEPREGQPNGGLCLRERSAVHGAGRVDHEDQFPRGRRSLDGILGRRRQEEKSIGGVLAGST